MLATRWVRPQFGLALTAAVLILSACAAPGRTRGAELDWASFIRFGGITYLENPYTGGARVGRALQVGDLGPVFAPVRHEVANSIHTPGYQLQDGDAAFLPVGPPVSTVHGYLPTFRLAAPYQGRLLLYEADTNPQAMVGQDLLDIAGKVRAISVLSSHDGISELAAITNPAEIATLVAMVLTAPVNQRGQNHSGTQYFLAFRLQDGTATVRSYWPGSGELSRGIMLPKGFATAIVRSVTSRSTVVTSSSVFDYPSLALGVVVDAQRRVVDIEANSAAERAGIQRGDLLIRVGTAPTLPSLDGAKRVLLEAKRESMLPVTISRDGHEVAIQVKLTPRLQPCAESPCATVTPVPVGRELAFL
ncbi:MAG: PDZ domain-containing protein [Chloroflexota bacterium]